MRANYAFRTLALDAGEHEIVFEYRPRSFTMGWICSLFVAGAMIAIGTKALFDWRVKQSTSKRNVPYERPYFAVWSGFPQSLSDEKDP